MPSYGHSCNETVNYLVLAQFSFVTFHAVLNSPTEPTDAFFRGIIAWSGYYGNITSISSELPSSSVLYFMASLD